MAYCPTCTASYTDEDYACPDCRTPLARGTRPVPEPAARSVAFVELYRCWNGLEADRLGAVLEARGIPAGVRSLGLSPYPLTIGHFAERRIAVPADLVDAARRVILQAIADGYVSGDGAWIPRPS